jgi:hypothetical protein
MKLLSTLPINRGQYGLVCLSVILTLMLVGYLVGNADIPQIDKTTKNFLFIPSLIVVFHWFFAAYRRIKDIAPHSTLKYTFVVFIFFLVPFINFITMFYLLLAKGKEPIEDLKSNTSNNINNQTPEDTLDKPLTSSELTSVMMFLLIFAASSFAFIGIIPIIFLLFGVFMMKKNHCFSYLDTALKNTKVYLALLVVIFFGFYMKEVVSHSISYYITSAEFWWFTTLILSFAVFALVLYEKWFSSLLKKHSTWVEKNGVFRSTPKKETPPKKASLRKKVVISSDTESLADELAKWSQLKVEGAITNDEYEKVKEKLLS